MPTSSIRTATTGIRADNSPRCSQERKRLPGKAGKPFSYLPPSRRKLRFCSRLSRCRLPHWLFRGPLFLRNVLFLHFGLLPVQEERRIRIVGSQRACKVHRAVLFHAC